MRRSAQGSAIAALLVIGTATACTIGPEKQRSASALVPDEAIVDAGAVTRGDNLRHTFHLTNRSSQTIRIDAVVASCSGTATASHPKVGPNGSVDISVKFDTRFLKPGGPTDLWTRVVTSEGLASELRVGVRTTVLEEFRLSQAMIEFDPVQQGTASFQHVALTTMPLHAFDIKSVRSTDRAVSVTVSGRQAGTGTESFQLEVVQRQDGPPGSHFGTILLETSSTLTPVIRIPVSGRIIASNFPLR